MTPQDIYLKKIKHKTVSRAERLPSTALLHRPDEYQHGGPQYEVTDYDGSCGDLGSLPGILAAYPTATVNWESDPVAAATATAMFSQYCAGGGTVGGTFLDSGGSGRSRGGTRSGGGGRRQSRKRPYDDTYNDDDGDGGEGGPSGFGVSYGQGGDDGSQLQSQLPAKRSLKIKFNAAGALGGGGGGGGGVRGGASAAGRGVGDDDDEEYVPSATEEEVVDKDDPDVILEGLDEVDESSDEEGGRYGDERGWLDDDLAGKKGGKKQRSGGGGGVTPRGTGGRAAGGTGGGVRRETFDVDDFDIDVADEAEELATEEMCDDNSDEEKGRGGGGGGGQAPATALEGRALLKRVLDSVVKTLRGVPGAYIFFKVREGHIRRWEKITVVMQPCPRVSHDWATQLYAYDEYITLT